ncbi:cell wall-binding repeat-containing protein [Euzebya sp.]|uniref:cell wall-binding repeat-containing protein n=1 Tax=Euzebya sp. TaxID=1971409 RepID=UPI00351571D2
MDPMRRRFPLRRTLPVLLVLSMALVSSTVLATSPVVATDGIPDHGEAPLDDHGHPHAPHGDGDSSSYAYEGDTRVVDLTFPLPEGQYQRPLYDSYYDGRSGGRTHRAIDVMADKMTPAHAVVGGTICYLKTQEHASAGWYFRLCGDDGLSYFYIHMNDDTPGTDDGMGGMENAFAPGIEEGARVERGDLLGWVGDSGNAESSGSHLHFEIVEDTDADIRINPYPSFEAAEARGDFPEAPSPMPAPTGGDDQDDDDQGDAGDDDGDDDDAPGDRGPIGFTRLAGDTRVATAVAMSRAARSAASTVVVVPAGSYVEALVSAPLAGFLDAPVLLTGSTGLDDDVSDEIRRLGARNAYLVGSPSDLPGSVEDDLRDAGVRNIGRLTGQDRYALSVAVAEDILTYGSASPYDDVILALGDADAGDRAWPDALSASALAANAVTPVLLVESDRLPDPVADFLTTHRPDGVTVVGGTAAISAHVAEEAAALAGGTATRLAGATRYETSVAIADAAVDRGLDAAEVWVATGLDYPDALAAGPAAAASGSPLVLVDGRTPGGAPASEQWLRGNAGQLLVVGGEHAVADAVASSLAG